MRALRFSPAILIAAALGSLSGCQRSQAEPGLGGSGGSATPAASAITRTGWDPPGGPRHAVFRLTDNRLLAHLVRRGGLVVPVGGPGFAKYVLGRAAAGWQTGLREEGRPVAAVTRPAELTVPLTAAQIHGARLFVRGASRSAQRLRITVNGRDLGPVGLAAGWQTVAIDPLPGALVAGENTLRLTPGARLAVEWIAVAREAPEDDPGPLHDGRGGLLLPPGGGFAWYVYLSRPGMALAAEAVGRGACDVTVRALPETGKLLERTGRAGPMRLDLSTLRDVVRLEVLAAGAACQGVTLKDGALTLPGAVPEVRYPKRPRNILLWLADSFRADKLPPYNPRSRVEMPTMTALARRGVAFWAYSQGNESRASHASLWTSTYPVNHRMIVDGAHLPQRFVTLPRAVHPAGVYTACITSNGYISKRWGFGEGWQFFRNNLHEGGGIMANDMTRWANQFLEQRAAKPFFLFVGTIDGHVSWRGREPWLSRYDSGPYQGPFVKWCSGPTLERVIAGRMRITERDKQRVRALYDSELSFNDHHFAGVLAKLGELGHADDTMIIVNADHGDEFWEKGRVGHGGSLRQTMVQVPLIISYPPLFPSGSLEDTGAEAIDILPTMCDALGVPIPDDAQGESLIPVAQGTLAGYPRPSFASQYELTHVMRLGRYKIFVGGTRRTLHDVVADPGEDHDLWSSRPLARRFMTDAMGFMLRYQAQWKKSRWGVASNQRPAFAADLEAGRVPPPPSRRPER